MITQILRQAFDENKLIGVTTKKIDWDLSLIGYIIDINNDNFTIKEIDQYGTNIGNTIIPFADVCYIEFQHRYISDLLFIRDHKFVSNPNLRVTIWKEGKNLTPHFQHVKDMDKIIRIFFDDDYFAIGKVLDFNNDFLLIKQIWKNGVEDGHACYRVKDIMGLRYDGLPEQKIKLLYETKRKTR